MSNNKLEISIIKDSNHKDAELEDMNLEVVEAFSVLVASLAKIVQNSPNKDSLKIRISKGSVRTAIVGTGLTQIKNDYLQIIGNKESDNNLIEPWKDLQKLIKRNHITFNSEFIVDGQKIIFHQILKDAKPLKAKKRINPSLKSQIKFFEGRLFQIGGKKNDNIHLEIDGENTIVIDCTIEQAENSTQYFKKKTLISAWVIPSTDKSTYKLCSSYFYEDLELFNRFKNFVNDFENSKDEIESLDKLHLECIKYLNNKDYKAFKRFLQLFNNDCIKINIVHTILMLTIPFCNHPDLKEVLDDLNSIFDIQFKRANQKPIIAIEKSN